jgi:hypothetical protein
MKLAVAIAQQDPPAACRRQARAQGGTVAQIAIVRGDTNTPIARADPLEDVLRAVATAVVDDGDLEIDAGSLQVRGGLLDHPSDIVHLVESGKDDGKIGT